MSSASLRNLGLYLLACALFTTAAFAQTDNWKGGAGKWSVAGNWSAGEPNSTSNVGIDAGNAKASPVTLDVQTTINNLTIDTDDSLSFNNGTVLAINGSTISNAGNISLNSAGTGTFLEIQSGAVLSGSGAVTMSNNSQNFVDGNSNTTLTNQSRIQGGGVIGPHIVLANQGAINANASGATMLVSQQTNATQTNTGTMEATNGGILQIATGGSGSVNNTGGTIKAVGTGSQVQLANGTTIAGGTLSTSSGGMLMQIAGGSSTLNGVTNAGAFSVQNNGTVNLTGTITNTGNFQLNSGGSLTELFVPSSATLTGAGSVTMGNNSQNEIDGNNGATLTIKQTIQGVGNIGPHFLFANQGTINANVKGAILNVLQESSGTDTNTATLEATNGGILQIQFGGSSNLNNAGGTIEAIGTGSVVQFTNGTTIDGGTLSTSGGGMLVQLAGGSVNLNGVTNTGAFVVQNNGTISLQSNLVNNGTISLKSAGNLTYLFLPTVSASLLGKGRVMMDNNVNSAIDGNGGLTFTNQSNIQGGGTIGPHFTFTNSGTLNVPKGNTLYITAPFTNFNGSTVTGGTYIVSGTLEFTNASIVTNSANITLSGTSAQIVNQSSMNALAGLYMNNKGASFTVTSGNAFTTPGNLSGVFTNAGTLKVGAGGSFKVSPTPPTVGNYTQSVGTTTVDGTLNVPSVTINAGSLLGKGSLSGSVTSSGLVTPGDSATKPGILSPNTYTQKSTGSLNIDIGGTTVGTQYGQLAVTNGASLKGTLNIKLVNGFVPAIGNTFTILTASAVSGTFATVNGLSINSGEHFDLPVYNANSVTLTVASGP